MAVADNAYSRFVQWVKVILPLLALGLLSTMFLFSRTVNPEDAIPISEVDVEQIAKEQRLAAPEFSAVTSDGSTVTVRAAFARPDLTDARRLTAEDVDAQILTQEGLEINIEANEALYDGGADLLSLMGDVEVMTSTGYVLRTETLVADLEDTGLVSESEVMGNGPSGRLEAGRMELRGQSGSQVLVFKDGVKLIYDPKN